MIQLDRWDVLTLQARNDLPPCSVYPLIVSFFVLLCGSLCLLVSMPWGVGGAISMGGTRFVVWLFSGVGGPFLSLVGNYNAL